MTIHANSIASKVTEMFLALSTWVKPPVFSLMGNKAVLDGYLPSRTTRHELYM